MERQIIVGLRRAFFLACIISVFCTFLSSLRYLQDSNANPFQDSILAYVPCFTFRAATIHSKKQLSIVKQATLKRFTKNNAKISIFRGRGAVRNVAIFHILASTGPLSIGDIQRKLNKIKGLEVTYYASLNKRIHALVRGGYIGEVKSALSQGSGFKVGLYEVRTKFYLAYYLNGRSYEEILSRLNELDAVIILSELINADITETSLTC